MKQLNLVFMNSADKTRVLRLSYVDENLGADQVKAAMAKIATANLFEKDDVQLYKKPIAAKYVERIETPIFNDQED